MSSARTATPRVTHSSPAKDDSLPRAGAGRTTAPRTRRRSETGVRLRTAMLRDFTTNERLLVLLWYAERMTPPEIGLVLDLTAEQVSRIHEAIITRLHASIDAA